MTNTTLIKMELVHFGGVMETARADYVRQAYRQDSTGVLNDSIVYYLSDGATDAQLKTLLAYHLKRGQFQQADSLNALAPTMRWTQQYTDVVTVLYDALTDTLGADAIVAQNESMLLDVAVEDSRETYLAQSILETYGLAEFDDIIVFPGEGHRSLMHQPANKVSSEKPMASEHPNPAKNTIYLNWRLPEEIIAENVQMLVYSSQGIQLHAERLNGPVGIIEINISNWPSGLYIYQLQHEQIKLHSEKFEVLR